VVERFKGRAIERLKEGIQFCLQGAVGLIKQKQNQVGEGQMAFAGKVLWMGASSLGWFMCFTGHLSLWWMTPNYMIFLVKCLKLMALVFRYRQAGTTKSASETYTGRDVVVCPLLAAKVKVSWHRSCYDRCTDRLQSGAVGRREWRKG